MKITSLTLAAVFLAAGCANDVLAAQKAAPLPASQSCDVAVVFGSYGHGIDRTSLDWIEASLRDKAELVAGVTSATWGDDGEQTLCIQAASAETIRQLFAHLKGRLPEMSSQAPITLVSRDGDRFDTKPGRYGAGEGRRYNRGAGGGRMPRDNGVNTRPPVGERN